MSRNKYTAQDFIKVISGSGGIITTIARRVGCDWHTAKKYITNYPTIEQAYRAEKESVLDMAEAKTIEAMNAGEQWAIKFYLTTIGKERGYYERRELAGTGPDGAIPITIVNMPSEEL